LDRGSKGLDLSVDLLIDLSDGSDHFDKRAQGKQVTASSTAYGTSDLPSKSPLWRPSPNGSRRTAAWSARSRRPVSF
jgi:hypothetical protein